MLNFSAPIFLFLHIPKTAGTSFRIALESQNIKLVFDYGNTAKETSNFLHKTLYQKEYQSFIDLFYNQGYQGIYGHLKVNEYLDLFGLNQIRLCTFLREPIQRVISEYYHRVRYENYQHSLEYAVLNEAWASNHQAQFISELDLENFFFIGITEYYQESVSIFNQLTNLKLLNLQTNLNPDKKLQDNYQISQNLLKLIKKFNQKDIILYNQAQNILAQQCQIYH